MKLIFSLIFMLLASSCAFAGGSYLGDPLSLTGELQKEEINGGDQVKIVFHIKLRPTYHAYEDSIKIQWFSPEGPKISLKGLSPVHEFQDPFSKSVRKA